MANNLELKATAQEVNDFFETVKTLKIILKDEK